MSDESLSPLLNAIEAYEQQSNRSGDLAKERVDSLNAYLGKPYGNEVDGRSQVVSRDVADTIEWIKPSLMRIFASGDEIVSFDPKGEEDVEAAQQESDYVNYILTQKNPWFRVAYVWFTDALMQKNAYVKTWYEEKTDVTEEEYEGKQEAEYLLIANDPEVEILEVSSYPDPMTMNAMDQMGNPLPPQNLYNFRLKKSSVYGCVKYQEIPPERTIVSQWATSIDLEDVDFFEHFEWQTVSEMKANGLKLPEHAGDDSELDPFNSEEEDARNLYGEPWQDETSPGDKRYKVRECWIRFDDDDDGLAELLHVIVVGRHKLLKEKADFIPAAAITPKMMPHRHVGRSIADEVMDLQLIKTSLLRGTLDNMYLGINGRTAIDEKRVNLDDMLTSRPGGVVRTEGPPANSILPFQHPNMMKDGIAAIEYIDQIKQNRTGVTAYVTSVDENVLNKTAAGTNMLQNAAMAKIELIARVFAETGVKRLMWLIHAMSLKHSRKAEIVRLRNKWVTVDPRQWKTRNDMTVSVGLGTGNRDQQMMHLGNILAIQEKLIPIGLVTKQNVRHAVSKYIQSAGFKDHESFLASSPQDETESQPILLQGPPDPVQTEKVKQEAENQRTASKIHSEEQLAVLKVQADNQRAVIDITAQKERELVKQAGESERQRMQIESAERIALAKIQSDERKAKYQAENAAMVKGAELASRERTAAASHKAE